MIALPDSEDHVIVCSFLWTKHQNLLDGWTDGRTDRNAIAITAHHALQAMRTLCKNQQTSKKSVLLTCDPQKALKTAAVEFLPYCKINYSRPKKVKNGIHCVVLAHNIVKCGICYRPICFSDYPSVCPPLCPSYSRVMLHGSRYWNTFCTVWSRDDSSFLMPNFAILNLWVHPQPVH